MAHFLGAHSFQLVLAIGFLTGISAENLAEISNLFQKTDTSKPLTLLASTEVASSEVPSGEKERKTCRGCDCYHQWMGQDYAGLTYCTSFNDISAENTETLPANMRCLVHDSSCEGSSEGKCSPACPRYTTNGCECAKSWVQEGYEECHDSCCNPTGDAKAPFCMVSDPSCQGMTWGPCSPEPMRAPHERKTAKGCKCANGWSVKIGEELQQCHTFCCTPTGLGLEGEVCVVEDETCEGMTIGRCKH